MTNALAAELAGRGVRINTVEPRAAVLSEGAEVLVGSALSADQIESMEEMVEAVVALCDCAPERTGLEHISLDLIAELGLTVRDLEGNPIAVRVGGFRSSCVQRPGCPPAPRRGGWLAGGSRPASPKHRPKRVASAAGGGV